MKIASKKYCKSSTTKEQGPNFKIDQCKRHCHSLNRDGNIKGYWWKPYRGGYCGCCEDVEILSTNWPDATTYHLEVAPTAVPEQRWKIVYTDEIDKERSEGFDKEHGLYINRPFYLKSRMPMGRVMESIGASNVTLKKWRNNTKAQQWRFDRVTNTIKNMNWTNYALEMSANGKNL